MIGIVDYGSGNVAAIANIHSQLKVPYLVSSDHQELASADRFLLPGVGAFDATMQRLRSLGLTSFLGEQVQGLGKKILGVCVGMQVLAQSSEEGVLSGLNWIPGRVRRITARRTAEPLYLPHMGWNSISTIGTARLFEGVDSDRGFYFLHSYYFDAADGSDVLAVVDYGALLPCAVARDNVYGVQFHPEKSHANGLAVFRNFAKL